jgi:polyhydroxybutyrate depolymerase
MKFKVILLATVLISTLVSPANANEVFFNGDRPFSVFVPDSYNSSTPAPLVIALTGYNQTGADFENYLKLTPLAKTSGFLYVYPDGTKDLHGIRFWNGTPECCDFQNPKVNDAAYIISIIDKIESEYSVDTHKIFIIGHSNGGFLANNLACHYSNRIAAIVNMAGGTYTKSSMCKPQSPINVLEIWGTLDDTYAINHILGRPIPGALKTLASWASLNKCAPDTLTSSVKLDLDEKVPGPETAQVQYQGCPEGGAVDFWRVVGAGHSPALTPTFDKVVVDWLMAHPKP